MTTVDVLIITGWIGSLATSLMFQFIYMRQYRFATLLLDFLPYYSILVLTNSFLGLVFGAYLVLRSNWLFSVLVLSHLIFNIYLVILFSNWRSDYRLEQYRNWLEFVTLHPDIDIISINEWVENQNLDPDKLLVIIRHDVDIYLSRTENMVEVETELNVPSCYFFRNNAERYTFQECIPLIRRLEQNPLFEIGFHYETISNNGGIIPSIDEKFEDEVQRFREVYPSLRMVSAHGDRFINRRLVTEQIVKLNDHNLVSSYDIGHDLYISEIGGNHHYQTPEGRKTFFDKLEILKNPPKGKLLQILVHADWWF